MYSKAPFPNRAPDDPEKAFETAARSLERSDKSEARLLEYLTARRGYTENAARTAVDRLKALGYVDDEKLAARLAQNCAEFGQSRRKAGQKLLQRGVSKEASEQALGLMSDERERENARACAEKLLPGIKGDVFTRKRKLYNRLLSKGFDYSAATAAMEGLDFSSTEEPPEAYD